METLQSLVNTVIGKIMIGVIAVLAVTSMSLSVWVYVLKADNKVAVAEKNQALSNLDTMSGILVKNYDEYQVRLEDANKTLIMTQKQYINTQKRLKTWEDHNDTCDEAMRAIDAYQF
ncbi:hypothetical protein [Sulfuricurvum sp.]|uniref:hypothetical protein n=1 Tax=Sulfuricurvum sp. TaxID=2025608 RepID=UPI00260340E1|nr:hypothetical protein [Sulfuricurvum sp.]MDD2267646.1 hypothetical protein [Sulfuricurvum sp.]MDD2784768.1 hypothetical protein [Sulfuricurvum sp.]